MSTKNIRHDHLIWHCKSRHPLHIHKNTYRENGAHDSVYINLEERYASAYYYERKVKHNCKVENEKKGEKSLWIAENSKKNVGFESCQNETIEAKRFDFYKKKGLFFYILNYILKKVNIPDV